MKNKVFNVWIKELASIVFTQALQALVLAVLMSVVVGLFLASKADGANTTNYAIGVYAIIAMMSLSKIELLVKRIKESSLESKPLTPLTEDILFSFRNNNV